MNHARNWTSRRCAAAGLMAICGLLAATGANAQDTYARESFTTTGAETVGGVTYYPVTMRSSAAVTNIRVPQAILSGLAYYVRVEMENMRVAAGSMTLRLANATSTGGCPLGYSEAGGSITFSQHVAGGTASVYALSDAVNLNANGCMRLSLDDSGLRIQSTATDNGYVTAKLYDSLAGAINGNDDHLLGVTSRRPAIVPVSAVRAKVTPMDAATASVERGFAAFAGASPNAANLASVKLLTTHIASVHYRGGTLTDGVLKGGTFQFDIKYVSASAGAGGNTAGGEMDEAKAAALVTGATVYLKSDRGDLAAGEYKLAGPGCANSRFARVASGERQGQLMARIGRTGKVRERFIRASGSGNSARYEFLASATAAADGPGCTLSLDVAANAALEAATPPGDFKAIKAQKFTVDVVVDLANPVPPPIAASRNVSGAAAGEIKRDGTTVHLPYLTTKPGYMHKVVLTNRGTKSADFWIESVSSSDGTGPTSRVTASTPMNVAAKDRKSVAVGDLVNFGTNGTEGAATLSVNAAQDNVSVATVLTNLSSRSTDSLSLVKPVIVVADEPPPPPPPAPPAVATNCHKLSNPAQRGSGPASTPTFACDDPACCNESGGGTCVTPGAGLCTETSI